MDALSPKRQQIVEFIASFIQERGYAPAVRDIVQGCALSSTSIAQHHLKVLERQGYIHRAPEVSRSIGLVKRKSRNGFKRLDMLPENWTTLSERIWYHGSAKEVVR